MKHLTLLWLDVLASGPMEELHSLDPRRQELLEARFTGAVSGNTGGSTGSTSQGAKVTASQKVSFLNCVTHIHTQIQRKLIMFQANRPTETKAFKCNLAFSTAS